MNDHLKLLKFRNFTMQEPKMDKVRLYLEKELRKNSKGGNGISKLHRECMIQALVRKKVMDSSVEKTSSNDHTRGDKIPVPMTTDCSSPKPLFVQLSPTNKAQTLFYHLRNPIGLHLG